MIRVPQKKLIEGRILETASIKKVYNMKQRQNSILSRFPKKSSHSFLYFLDAFSHLYKRVCRSVRRSVTPSLKRLLGASYAEYSALFSQCVWHISHGIIAMEKNVKNSNDLFFTYRYAFEHF